MGNIILILTACVFAEKVKCYIITAPTDTEVMVNESTFLNCSTSIPSQEVAWYRYRVGDPYRRHDVYDAGVIDRSYGDRFYIDGDKTNGVFNLVMKSIQAEDAGKYECQDNGGIGEKRSAELIVIDRNGPVCQSNIPHEGVIGPNDCGVEPTTFELSCRATFHGNSPPQLEWSQELRNSPSKNFNQVSSCNSTDNEATCNMTVKTQRHMSGSSIVCRTPRSPSHRCTIDDFKVLYAFNNREGVEKTLNEKVTCSANSSQYCTYTWKWFEWEYDIKVSSNSEITATKEGWHRCEAECHFGNITCPLVAMVIHVSSPSIEYSVQDSGSTVAVLSWIVAVLLLFIFLILGFVVYLICKKRIRFPTCTSPSAEEKRISTRQIESLVSHTEPAQVQEELEVHVLALPLKQRLTSTPQSDFL